MKRKSDIVVAAPNLEHFESRALAKGLLLLERLAEAELPMSLGELSRLVQLGKASTLRLVRTLEAAGYIARDGNETYRTGVDWSHLTQQRSVRKLRAAAAPFLRTLNADLGESVALAFLFKDQIRVVDALESSHQIRMANYLGRILQPYASSLGKAITAFQPAERAHRLVQVYGIYRLTRNTITDLAALQEEFALVRQQGYACDREETVEGGECFGAPIFDESGQAVGALSVSTPKPRLTERLQEMLPQLVKVSGARVSAAIRSPDGEAALAPHGNR